MTAGTTAGTPTPGDVAGRIGSIARRRPGRPQSPDTTRRVLVAARAILAGDGLPRFTADAIARDAGVGKASIYRRWRTLDEVLAAVVLELGVRPVGHGAGRGTLVADLARVLHAATTGRDARAELAVLSAVARSEPLRTAYLAGPLTRLVTACNVVEVRGRHRGEPPWPSLSGVLAGFRLLQHRVLVGGGEPTLADAGCIVADVVLPSLGRTS